MCRKIVEIESRQIYELLLLAVAEPHTQLRARKHLNRFVMMFGSFIK